jgi:hypothetical protein
MVCDHEMQVVHRATESGESFGANALESKDAGRGLRVVTVTDCHFAVISKVNYKESVEKCRQKVREDEVKFLRSIPFLSHLSKHKCT